MTTRLVVINGGMRVPSTTKMLADQLTQASAASLEAAGLGVEVTTIDVRDHAQALADALLTGFASGELATALEAVAATDALIAVTPTFQASFSGLFKSFLDLVEPDTLTGVPVVLGATGGTERHSLMLEHAMRPLFTHMGADPVRTATFAATADFGTAAGSALRGRVAQAATELTARVVGVAPERQRGASGVSDEVEQADGIDEVVPFERMLAGLRR